MPRPSTVNTLCYLYNFLGIIQFKMNYKASAYSVIQEAMSALPQVSATARLLATLAQFYMIDENLPQLRAILPALLVERTALTEKELIRLYLMNWLLGRVYDMLDDTKQSYHSTSRPSIASPNPRRCGLASALYICACASSKTRTSRSRTR